MNNSAGNQSISNFFSKEYCDYVSYDNIRKISSAVDGLKISGRKVLYTMIDNNVNKPVKVSILKSVVSAKTQYLHGDDALASVLVNLANNYDNNIPLFKRGGMFGTRVIKEAAAPRYIFSCKEDYLDKIFRPDDNPILVEQTFEGDKIEPTHYVPILPMIAVNGGVGISTGFAQKILPRNPIDLIKYLKNKLKGMSNEKNIKLRPWLKGFSGEVTPKPDSADAWLIKGHIVPDPVKNSIRIDEIPFTYDLSSYIAVLNKLVESKKIKSFKECEVEPGHCFNFIVNFDKSGPLSKNSPNLLEELKLIVPFTENYTCLNAENKLVEFESIYEVIDYYCNVRLDFYTKRKAHLIDELTKKLNELRSRYKFISKVCSNEIVISRKSSADIIKQIEKIKEIIKINDSYDYLVNMPIRNMSKEYLLKFKADITELETKLNKVINESETETWQFELDELKKVV